MMIPAPNATTEKMATGVKKNGVELLCEGFGPESGKPGSSSEAGEELSGETWNE